MKKNLINLWEDGKIPFYNKEYDYDVNENTSTLTPFLLEDGKSHGAMLVFPGGGYTYRSEKEGTPVAEYMNSLGFHAFVVNYRVIPYDPYLGCIDGKRAVKYLRAHAKELGVIADCIGVIGFSAGAGNACLVTETYDKPEYDTTDWIDDYSAKPDFGIFSYGALSLKMEFLSESDVIMIKKLVPEEFREAYLSTYSCDELVRENMPPVFVWHTADDDRVGAGAAIEFIRKMQEKGNTYEFHIFPNGGHGKSVTESAKIDGMCQWMPLAKDWMRREGFLITEKETGKPYITMEEVIAKQGADSRVYRFLTEENGCKNGCSSGITVYSEYEFSDKPGKHQDQEGFYVLEGEGYAKLDDLEFPIQAGDSFLALPGVAHTIRTKEGCIPVKVFWFHSAV